MHFRYWPIQGHLGAIFGSFGVGVRSEICIGVSSYIRKKSFSKHCFILRFYFWPILGSFWAFWDCVGLFWVRGGVRKLFWGLLFYTINFCFLSNPKILVFFILTNFRVLLDSLGCWVPTLTKFLVPKIRLNELISANGSSRFKSVERVSTTTKWTIFK